MSKKRHDYTPEIAAQFGKAFAALCFKLDRDHNVPISRGVDCVAVEESDLYTAFINSFGYSLDEIIDGTIQKDESWKAFRFALYSEVTRLQLLAGVLTSEKEAPVNG